MRLSKIDLVLAALALAALFIGLGLAIYKTDEDPTDGVVGSQANAESLSFEVHLSTGPVVSSLVSDQGVRTMGQMTGMTFTDLGQPVNRHIELHVIQKSTDARRLDIIPTITVTDEATGISREMASWREVLGEHPNVMACKTGKHKSAALHFGDNLYLPSGAYTLTVGVALESVVMRIVV